MREREAGGPQRAETAALEESEGRYRAFVSASYDAVYRMGPDWSEMRQLDGRGFVSDTSGPTEGWMERYVHPDDRPLVGARIREAVRTKGVFELEHRVLRVDGTPGWTLSRAVPVLGADGEILEWLGTARDVTARKEAEEALRESEEKYRTLFASIDEGFCIVEVLLDGSGEAVDYRFLETNPAFERQTGLEDAVGKTMREIESEHEEFWFEVYGRIARTDEALRFEHEAAALGRFYDVYAFRIGAPGENRVAIIFNDILPRRRAEEERGRRQALEASARAEAAERERISRELHDRVAHHMGVAHQSLELHAALAESAPERAAEKLRLARETTRLALDQTRAISAELKRLQDEELGNGLGAALRALADELSDGCKIDVRFVGEDRGLPKPVALQVYLATREAVRNAVKHAGCSRVDVTMEIRDGEVAGLVEDDGSGFDPEAVHGATPSWGVGLRSMRERAEMLGGDFRADSAPGKGTRIVLRVPTESSEIFNLPGRWANDRS